MKLIILEEDEQYANFFRDIGKKHVNRATVFRNGPAVWEYISELEWNEGVLIAISMRGDMDSMTLEARIKLAQDINNSALTQFYTVVFFYERGIADRYFKKIQDARPFLLHRLPETDIFRKKNGCGEPEEVTEIDYVFKAAAENLDNLLGRKLDSLTRVLSGEEIKERLEVQFFLQNRNISPLFIDVDDLKKINDAHGHQCGDEVLKSVARAIWSALRPLDSLGRVGGDEFLAVIHGVGRKNLEMICKRVLERVRELKVESEGVIIRPTVTIGASACGSCIKSCFVYKLIKKADTAMYSGKIAGKDTYHIAL